MKNFNVNFNSRCRLVQVLNNIPGPLGRLRLLLPILDKISFTDEYWKKVKIVQNGNQTTCVAPNNEFGNLKVELENAEADALIKELENSTEIVLNDYRSWVKELLKDLKE